MEKLSKLEILNETIAHYNGNVNRRSIDDNRDCLYNDGLGNHCAIGRCMLDELKEQGLALVGNRGGFENLASSNNLTFDLVLQEKYRGHEYDFWILLQQLHDEEEYWDNAGITADGELFANEICERFKLKPLADA